MWSHGLRRLLATLWALVCLRRAVETALAMLYHVGSPSLAPALAASFSWALAVLLRPQRRRNQRSGREACFHTGCWVWVLRSHVQSGLGHGSSDTAAPRRLLPGESPPRPGSQLLWSCPVQSTDRPLPNRLHHSLLAVSQGNSLGRPQRPNCRSWHLCGPASSCRPSVEKNHRPHDQRLLQLRGQVAVRPSSAWAFRHGQHVKGPGPATVSSLPAAPAWLQCRW